MTVSRSDDDFPVAPRPARGFFQFQPPLPVALGRQKLLFMNDLIRSESIPFPFCALRNRASDLFCQKILSFFPEICFGSGEREEGDDNSLTPSHTIQADGGLLW
jgi:hypothetical protein